MKITKKTVMANPLLKLGFKMKKFKDNLNPFIEYANKGRLADKREIIDYLIEQSIKYYDYSEGESTVLWDFGWSVLENNPEFWSEKEKKDGFSDLYVYWRSSPKYSDIAKDQVLKRIDYGFYFLYCMDFFDEQAISRPDYFCYAMYLFFEQWKPQFTKEVIDETKEIIEEFLGDDL